MRIDVTPHTSLLKKIGQASFSIWQAISELIANSLEAVPIGEKAEIHIHADLERILVVDNGVGMEKEVMIKAVRMAWPMEEICPYGSNSKRVFGLGMKTACASLGRWWSVETVPTEGATGYRVAFDLDDWSKRDKWETDLEEISPSEVKLLKGAMSGTVITIRKLKIKPIPESLRREISRAYVPHIRSGDRFYVNEVLLREEPPDLIPNTEVKVDITVEGVQIQGWGALMSKGSLTNYGFHWYRKGQLIEAFDKSFIPNHPAYRQVIGELHVDKMPVNFTKKGFEKESKEWKQAIAELPEVFQNLLNEAKKTRRQRRKDEWTDKEQQDAMDVMNRVGKSLASTVIDADGSDDFVLAGVVENFISEQSEKTEQDIRSLATRHPIKVGDQEVRWRHRFACLGEEGPLLDYALERQNELLIVTNLDSPFSQILEDKVVLSMINVAEAISRFLVEDLGYDQTKAKSFRDVWLANASAILRVLS